MILLSNWPLFAAISKSFIFSLSFVFSNFIKLAALRYFQISFFVLFVGVYLKSLIVILDR